MACLIARSTPVSYTHLDVYKRQVLHSRQVDPELHTLVKGLMIESYIEPGNQKIGCDHIYGKSITDPCLGWEESERLLYTIAEMC